MWVAGAKKTPKKIIPKKNMELNGIEIMPRYQLLMTTDHCFVHRRWFYILIYGCLLERQDSECKKQGSQ